MCYYSNQLTCVITLTSCLEKLFWFVINSRLTFFVMKLSLKPSLDLEKVSLLQITYLLCMRGKNFIVHLLISVRHSTFCGELASGKMLKRSKCYKIIYMIILNLAFCIMISNQTFFLFSCMTGIRQLANLSPFYFLCF